MLNLETQIANHASGPRPLAEDLHLVRLFNGEAEPLTKSPATEARKQCPLPAYRRARTRTDRAVSSVCIPALALAAANAYILYKKHWEHWSHMPPLEERVQYPYQNIRTKNFPWGDGDKTLLWVVSFRTRRTTMADFAAVGIPR